ncbi:MAG: RagB/SusD family nutrient uptake outer membrane protein [Cyclobacteriaceae bacterium]
MKSLHIYIILIVLGVGFSCSGILDIEPDGVISGDIYTDAESIEKALTGAYYNFTGISDGNGGGELVGGDFIMIPTLLARLGDQEIFWSTVQAPAYSDFINKNILETNLRVKQNWQRAYETINTVNNILANLNNIESVADRSRIEGEARAIRGILYFEMIRLWAPQADAPGVNAASQTAIPLITEPIVSIDDISAKPELATIDAVYAQAETDLTSASGLLEPLGTNGTRLSYYACQAYLARMSMQLSDFGAAFNYANTVISSGAYDLADTPLEAFNNSVNGSEDIFAVQQTLANNTGDRSSGGGITTFHSSLAESGLGIFVVLSSSFNSSFMINAPNFSANDLRASVDLSVTSSSSSSDIDAAFYKNLYNNFDELISPAKYLRTDHVLPVVRLAEMYLIRAEASNEISGLNAQAVEDLNMIRTRAGISAVQLTDFANLDQFWDSVRLERNRELLHEGQLLHDLKRWGGEIGSLFDAIDAWDDELVLPIPRAEQDAWNDE